MLANKPTETCEVIIFKDQRPSFASQLQRRDKTLIRAIFKHQSNTVYLVTVITKKPHVAQKLAQTIERPIKRQPRTNNPSSKEQKTGIAKTRALRTGLYETFIILMCDHKQNSNYKACYNHVNEQSGKHLNKRANNQPTIAWMRNRALYESVYFRSKPSSAEHKRMRVRLQDKYKRGRPRKK